MIDPLPLKLITKNRVKPTNMNINLNDVDFKEVFTAAIMQSLDNGKKEELIKGAVQFLLTKDRSSYNKNPPIKEAFETALRAETITFLREYISKDESIKTAITDLIKDAVTRITSVTRDATVIKIADKIIEGITEKY